MITQKQLNNLHNLPLYDVSLILDECIEALGLCDIQTACYAMGVQRSRVYQLMTEDNTKQIGIHKFPMINILTNKNN